MASGLQNPTSSLPNPLEGNEFSANSQVEVDEASFSDYSESGNSNATQSVTSSVRAYVYENGRRYQAYGDQGKYLLPNDETEQDRLDLTHHLALQILSGELHTAPLKEVHRVLDCGTGTGIWALDFGDQHPECEVIGVDLSPIQPSWVFPNVKFEIDDLEKDWTWPENHFDFIHSRTVINGIRDFKRYIGQMYRHAKPGGYVELSEFVQDLMCQDGTLTEDTKVRKWMDDYNACARKASFRFPTGEELAQWLKDAGFVEVTLKSYMVPWWGPWAKDKRLKEIGFTGAAVLETGFDAYGLHLLTNFGGYTHEDARKLSQDCMKEVLGRKVHSFILLVQVVGRKPMEN